MTITVTQYVRPHGKRRFIYADGMPDDLAPMVEAITKAGCTLTAEELSGMGVCFAVDDGEQDLDSEIVSNGPGTKEALEKLIRRWYSKYA